MRKSNKSKKVRKNLRSKVMLTLIMAMLMQSLAPMQINAADYHDWNEESQKQEESQALDEDIDETERNSDTGESRETTPEETASEEIISEETTSEEIESEETTSEVTEPADESEVEESVELLQTQATTLSVTMQAMDGSTTLKAASASAIGTTATLDIIVNSDQASVDLEYTSESLEVATVTGTTTIAIDESTHMGTGTATVTYQGYGVTRVTVTVKESADSTATSSCDVKVYPIPEGETLIYELDPEVPAGGLAYGEQTTLKIYSSADVSKEHPLPGSMFEFSTTSLVQEKVSISATGVITGKSESVTEETVLVTAKLKDDPTIPSRTVIATIQLKAKDQNDQDTSPVADFEWDSVTQTTIIKYTGSDSAIIIPERARVIGERAFMNNTSITSVDFSKSHVTKIENGKDIDKTGYLIAEGAFKGCSNLKSITWNDSIDTIGNHAFDNCTSLSMLECPPNLRTIGKRAFSGCTSMIQVNLNNKLETIGLDAFNRCAIGKGSDGTKTLLIPGSVKLVDESAFCGCDYLESVYFEESSVANAKLTFGKYVFQSCDRLHDVYLPTRLEKVNAFDFYSDMALEILYVPSKDTTFNEESYTDSEGKEQKTGNAIQECPKLVLYVQSASKALDYAKKYGELYNPETDHIIDEKKYFRYKVTGANEVLGLILDQHLIIAEGVEGLQNGKIVLTVPNSPMALNPTVLPDSENNRTKEITYKSSNVEVATVTVGADKRTAIIMPTGFGITEIKATCGGVTDICYVYVYPLPAAVALSNSIDHEIPELGFEKGMTMTMDVRRDKENGRILEPSMCTFSTSDSSLATVDENGRIEIRYGGSGQKTVAITATLKNDPAKRKTTRKLTVIDRQIHQIAFSASGKDLEERDCVIDNTKHNSVTKILIDRNRVATGDFTFELAAACYPMAELGTEAFYKELAWTSSDTRIGKLQVNTGGDSARITIPAGADGAFIITATGKDLKKTVGKVEVYVAEFAPRIETTTLTMNGKMYVGTSLEIQAAYGNNLVWNDKQKMKLSDQRFALDYEPKKVAEEADKSEMGSIYIKPAEMEELPAGNYLVSLTVPTENGKEYVYALQIRVTAQAPQLSIKQKGKFNLFYKDSTLVVELQSKNGAITEASINEGQSTFVADFDAASESIVIHYHPEYLKQPGKVNKKVSLSVRVDGYMKPVVKTITIATQETKPKLLCNRTTTYFYGNGTAETSGTLIIQDQQTGSMVDEKLVNGVSVIDAEAIKVDDAGAGYVAYKGATRMFTPVGIQNGKFANGKSNVTVKLKLQNENWIKPVTINHKLAISSEPKKPDKTLLNVKLAKNTLTLNANTIDKVTGESADYVELAIQMNLAGYAVTSVRIDPEESQSIREKFQLKVVNGKLRVTLTNRATKGTYKLPLQYTLVSRLDPTEVVNINPKGSTRVITIKVVDQVPTFKISRKGKIDCIQLQQGIEVTINGINGMNYHAGDFERYQTIQGKSAVALSGEGAAYFDVTPIQYHATNGKAYFIITPKTVVNGDGKVDVAEKLYTNQKYSIGISVNIQGVGSESYQPESIRMTIQPTQSAMKAKVSGNVLYQSNLGKERVITLTPSTPAGAVFMGGTKADVILPKQITEEDITILSVVENESDGKSIDIHYVMNRTASFQVGKSYVFQVKVTPVGCAKNKTATTVKVTCKVKK